MAFNLPGCDAGFCYAVNIQTQLGNATNLGVSYLNGPGGCGGEGAGDPEASPATATASN